MAQNITNSVMTMVKEAKAQIEEIEPQDAIKLHDNPDVVLVDIRDPREQERDGRVPGAFHAPRGMLEFWVDPESPYHKPIFAQDKTFIIHCASGWRSLLATQAVQKMGLKPVKNMKGGFTAWKDAGGAIEKLPGKKST
jgi:rhodanese-related sulfurtransferase